MRKAECKQAILQLIHQWARLHGVQVGQADMPSYSQFRSWCNSNGYSHYFRFRSVAGSEYDAEIWFDRELGQSWRN